MITKHLIACSVILLLIIFTEIFIGRNTATPINSFPQKVDFPSPREQKGPSSDLKRSLKFATERIPVHNKKVAWKMDKYLKATSFRHIQTGRLHQQAARWFPVIEPILKQHGIPEDFKYIPLVESGLLEGTSNKGASGYWQFMPQTARDYGLRVGPSVDERQDLRKSTNAACLYLNSLYKEFKSWTLVAAAYNVGENSLSRQIAIQGHNDYFMMKLNRETASYVYKLISMKEIIEHPLKYGFASRSKNLLARDADESKPRHFMSPAVERDALKALSLLQPETM